MLRIEESGDGDVVFSLSGQLNDETTTELQRLIEQAELRHGGITLNLRNLTLADERAVDLLEVLESKGVTLENCPPYVREWINRRRRDTR